MVTLRDRLRRWWSPARWEDDHPTARKQRAQPKKNALARFFSNPGKNLDEGGSLYGRKGGGIDHERDFKKPR